ncbi:MAG: hypothetical protein IPO35_19365 [Uliginosibacterium sp.]|nr:hypothetical protein [Uliginosibacterium sp.]
MSGDLQQVASRRGAREAALDNYLDGYRRLFTDFESRFEKGQGVDALFQIIDDLIPLAPLIPRTWNRHSSQRASKLGDDIFLITMRDRANDPPAASSSCSPTPRLALDFRRAQTAEAPARAIKPRLAPSTSSTSSPPSPSR